MTWHDSLSVERDVAKVLARPIEPDPIVQLPSESLRSTSRTRHKLGLGALCRMCLREQTVRPHSTLTRHHIVPVRWFRRQPAHVRAFRNAAANVIPLCRPCHDLVESVDAFQRETARRHLRRSMTQQEVAFVIAVRGRPWLEHHYPVSHSGRRSTGSPPST